MKKILACMLFVVLLLSGCTTNAPIIDKDIQKPFEKIENIPSQEKKLTPKDEPVTQTEEIVYSTENPFIDVVFVDVGQGDGAFIVTSNNDIILIDAGVDKDASQIIEAMNEYEFDNIDLMILTHPHADHIGGASTILNTYDVSQIWMPEFEATSKTYKNMVSEINALNIPVETPEMGNIVDIDGVQIEVLASDVSQKDNNNSSIVTRICYDAVSFMFTGDAEEEVEEYILDNYSGNIYSNILKAGHHGSKTSSSKRFLEAVSPEYVILSYETGNQYGHPHMETLYKFKNMEIPYFSTADLGNILVRTNGTDIEIS